MRTVLAASALAMLVAEQYWLAGVLAVSFARFWGELVAVARPRWEALGHCTAPGNQHQSYRVQCKSRDSTATVCSASFVAEASSRALLVSKRPSWRHQRGTCPKHSHTILLDPVLSK